MLKSERDTYLFEPMVGSIVGEFVRREEGFRDTNNCGFLLFLFAVANTFYLSLITMIERHRLSIDHRRSSLALSVLLT